MSDNFQIKISAANTASNEFKKLTADTKALGTAVEETSNKSSRSLQQLNQRAAAFGAALGGATLLMGQFARAAAEDEASQQRLEQSVSNTGDSLDEYSAKLEIAIKQGQEKAFTDDQTRDALVKLNLATNDTEKSIEQLGLAMDLSRARGISLSQAAEIIGKAYQGQYGALSRMGIVLDSTATSAEALAAVQQKVAGQAATYAETSAGQIDILKDKWGEATEAVGAHAGALQSVLLLLPGLQAGYVGLAGAIGGLGGLGALARFAGPAALVAGAGSLAYGYSQDTLGTTQTNKFWNDFFKMGAETLNALIPGYDPLNAQKYTDQMATNAQWDLINAAMQSGGMSQAQTVQALAGLLGVQGTTQTVDQGYWKDENGNINYGPPPPGVSTSTSQYVPPSDADVLAVAQRAASNRGMSLDQYIRYVAGSTAGYAVDPVTGKAMSAAAYGSAYQSRVGAQYGYTGAPTMGFGAIAATGYGGVSPAARAAAMRPSGAPMEFDPSAQMARAGGIPAGGGSGFLLDAAANADKTTAALKETLGAYYNLVTGMNVAGGAMQAFKATQDELIDRESVYGQQISEFSQQQNALTAGYDLINEKKANGVELTKQEQDFLEKYPDLYERVKGGVDDATESQAFLAAAYIENMEKGDQLNETLQGQAESTEGLQRSIDLLILSMNGVPAEVRTAIYLDNIDLALANISTFAAFLAGLPDKKSIEIQTTYSDYVPGSMTSPFMHGGVAGYANGGIPVRLAEAGPDFLSFANGGSAWATTDGLYNVPRGTYVTPAPASRGRGGGGSTFNVYGTITVVANDPRQMAAAINEWAVGSSRS